MSNEIVPDIGREPKQLLLERDSRFYECLSDQTRVANTFQELAALSTLRKRAAKLGFARASGTNPLRLAIIGGYSLYPLHDLIQHCLETADRTGEGQRVELLVGDYDNYISEIIQETSRLYEFGPDAIFVIPSGRHCEYSGRLFDSRSAQEAQARDIASNLLELCRIAHIRTNAEIILANYPLPSERDPGAYRTRTAGSTWTFRKIVNLELGLSAPSFIRMCDVEFLSARFGSLNAYDARAWFESKQPYSADFLVQVAKEVAHIVAGMRQGTKKVVAVDLDNTLWGGVVGDDGVDGIEIGDTSPRGEAFKAFQLYLKSLTERGILLAVCSKNDKAKAIEPFEKHPDMVLRLTDIVAFKANWEPKSDNLRRIAEELNLGMDSIVFVDDNPAEVEIVRQFAPDVCTVLLGPDPSDYIRLLQEGRYFEPVTLTSEDFDRVKQYQQESDREKLLTSSTDMAAYLRSLQMRAVVSEFQGIDVPRIAQLINKSNQFNLTTRRRTEAEVRAVMEDTSYLGFTVRLSDRFGDYGLIAVIICRVDGTTLEIETWLMSCRVLERQVEEEVINEIRRLAATRDCKVIRGRYVPTPKNGIVRGLYPRMGFTEVSTDNGQIVFELRDLVRPLAESAIRVERRAYDQVFSA